ncbi:nudix hydrolase 13, mitochondrial-like isoform X2 [Oryza brachyantha]|uniref:Nudix hydrolase domain-containing protein n=1 Tax=Oryza brachyantha TaxID=4533 RepID=J3N8T0_ORYBR|nr:nudix hydrolase 13, mitochondrial-like isoform X2 [Oryza brachyantha]
MRKSWSCSWICPLEVIVQIRKLFFSSKGKMAPSSPPAMNMGCARQGRLRQRYEGCYRLVSGCIPYMIKEDGENSSSHDDHHVLDRVQVLMISTPKRSDLIFPKGGWEDDESIDEAACREAFEEAGVRGVLSRTPLGEWIFKSKSKQNSCGLEGACKGFMFALQVTELLESWPEQTTHGRRWVPVEEAYGLCRYDWMREALDKLKEQLLCAGDDGLCAPSPSLVEMPAPGSSPPSSSLYMVMPAVAEGAVALC